jgi:hypothetical protein
MDKELERLEESLRQASDNLMRFLRELFGAEDDPRALELLRLTSKKEVAEDALVTYLLDTMPLDDLGEGPPPPQFPPDPPSGGFLH